MKAEVKGRKAKRRHKYNMPFESGKHCAACRGKWANVRHMMVWAKWWDNAAKRTWRDA